MSTDLRIIRACRACGNTALEDVFSLGELYVSDFVRHEKHALSKQYPLTLVLCGEMRGGCGLLQLRHTVSNELMYRTYWYVSGTNRTMTNQLHDIVRAAKCAVNLSKGDVVIDIGCNDGTLLRGFAADPVVRVGFEPARNLVPIAKLSADRVINDFWNAVAFLKAFPDKKAKIITAISMFYDVDNPNAFVADVARVLADDGVFIIQMSYLPLMLSQNAFDNICHEHLGYYSLRSLEHLLGLHGLVVGDMEKNDVNGGSFRVSVAHQSSVDRVRFPAGAAERLRAVRREEEELGLDNRVTYDRFFERVRALKDQTLAFIRNAVTENKKVYVYGASTKGNTLLQFYGIDPTLVTFAADRNPGKWGKKTVGSLIPIISEEQARADFPDYFLVLPWHFLDEFREREYDFLNRGGTFILPLPELKIVGSEQ